MASRDGYITSNFHHPTYSKEYNTWPSKLDSKTATFLLKSSTPRHPSLHKSTLGKRSRGYHIQNKYTKIDIYIYVFTLSVHISRRVLIAAGILPEAANPGGNTSVSKSRQFQKYGLHNSNILQAIGYVVVLYPATKPTRTPPSPPPHLSRRSKGHLIWRAQIEEKNCSVILWLVQYRGKQDLARIQEKRREGSTP